MEITKDEVQDWKAIIVNFFETKIATTKLYKAREFIEKKNQGLANAKDEKKRQKLEKAKKDKQKELDKLRQDAPATEIREWIDKSSKTKIKNKAERIIKATHVLRFSHSSASAQGLIDKGEDTRPSVLTTSSIMNNVVYDMAHNNGALVSISRFLSISLGDDQIFDLLVKRDFSFFKPFAKDDEQIDKWGEGFLSMIKTDEIQTGDKAKQIYFPIKQLPETDKDFHLIISLFSSSLCEKIYTSINETKYDENQKQYSESIRNQRKNGQGVEYLSGISTNFPDLAIQKFGGAQPQNVSMLNKARKWKARKEDKTTWGITYLFSAQPPIWQSQLKPPVYRYSLFDDLSNETIRTEMDYLRDFLLRFKQLDLSIKNPKRFRHLERWVNTIIDEFLFYIGTIQNLPAGWSNQADIRLKKAHQYLLDPYRQDESFQAERQNMDWQKVIRDDFAAWMNKRLRGKDKHFTPKAEHSRLWKKLLEQPLREQAEYIESELKYKKGERV